MDSKQQASAEAVGEHKAEENQPPPYAAAVDPFLVEALQNPRHRLTS